MHKNLMIEIKNIMNVSAQCKIYVGKAVDIIYLSSTLSIIIPVPLAKACIVI